MKYQVRPLNSRDFPQASELDKKWFGEAGISKEELTQNLNKNNYQSLGVFMDKTLNGFSIFEVLNNNLPSDYISNLIPSGKILFIQQFTTESNYKVNNWNLDAVLLKAIEDKAKELKCTEIWEALDKDHPFKKENNPQFDAFGFYEKNKFNTDKNIKFTWQPNKSVSIDCYLLKKTI